MGCQKIEYPTEGSLSVNGAVSIPITITLPHPPSIETRATSPLLPNVEDKIGNLCVAVFGKPKGTANEPDILVGIRLVENPKIINNKTKVELVGYTGAYKYKVIANYSKATAAKLKAFNVYNINTPSIEATTLDDFLLLTEDMTALYKTSDYGAINQITKKFPMSSGMINSTTDNIIVSTQLSATLKNCYSRITVDASAVNAGGGGSYNIISAMVSHGAPTCSFNTSAVVPVVAAGDATAVKYSKSLASTTLPTASGFISPIYLFPNSNSASPTTTNPENSTYLIIEGSYKGVIGFHKLRIRYNTLGKDAKSQNHFYDIKHNSLYKIKIVKVRSTGYPTAEEAINAEPTNANIQYDITIDDGTSHDVVVGNGAYYIGFSNSDLFLYGDGVLTDIVATTVTCGAGNNTPADIVLPEMSITLGGTGITWSDEYGGVAPVLGTSGTMDIKINLAANISHDAHILFRYGSLAHKFGIKKSESLDYRIDCENIEKKIDNYLLRPVQYAEFVGDKPDWIGFTSDFNARTMHGDGYSGTPLKVTRNTGTETRTADFYFVDAHSHLRHKWIISQKAFGGYETGDWYPYDERSRDGDQGIVYNSNSTTVWILKCYGKQSFKWIVDNDNRMLPPAEIYKINLRTTNRLTTLYDSFVFYVKGNRYTDWSGVFGLTSAMYTFPDLLPVHREMRTSWPNSNYALYNTTVPY
jgi:hypothetical protein